MKNLKLIFLFIFLGSLFSPLVSLAALNSYQVDDTTVYYEGLIPCGKSKDIPLAQGESEEVRMPCQFCHFFVMFDGIVDFVLKLVIIIGILMLTVGGFMFFFAGGNPGILAKAKSILTSVAIGLVIIFAAYLIIGTILQAIGLSDWTKEIYQNWWKEGIFQIECPITPFVEKEKEGYQKKITNLEKEIAELEEDRTTAARDQNIEWLNELTEEIDEKKETLTKLVKEKESEEKEKEAKKEVTQEEKEKHCRWEECGRGPLNPCDEEECLALGDSIGPCQFIPTWRFFSWTEWYGECKPK